MRRPKERANEAEKCLKLYPKILWFTVIGTLIFYLLLFVLTLQKENDDHCKRRAPTNNEQILHWLCHFCCFVMTGFQIAFVYSANKAVQKRNYVESVFAFKMMAGCMLMFGLIVVFLCNDHPLRLNSCPFSDNLEAFRWAMVSVGFMFLPHAFGICKVRSSLSDLARYGKMPPSSWELFYNFIHCDI